MKRDFLFAYYETPRGKLLKELESSYLKSAITVSCKQSILQIGGLDWESEYIDCSLYTQFTILDAKNLGYNQARKIRAKAYQLPLQADSIDLIILPHLLEFDAYRFQTMREIERVLKPEGMVIILNFNPLSFSVRYQSILDRKLANSWRGHFISQSRLVDWFKLLNFQVIMNSQFHMESYQSSQTDFQINFSVLTSTAYAVKAIKRRYNLIPLTPVKEVSPNLAMANMSCNYYDNNEY